MGDKIHSKIIARKAKISMIPGYDGEVKDEDECVRVSILVCSESCFQGTLGFHRIFFSLKDIRL